MNFFQYIILFEKTITKPFQSRLKKYRIETFQSLDPQGEKTKRGSDRGLDKALGQVRNQGIRRVMGPKSERNVLKVKKGHVKVQTERRLQGAENIVKAKGHGMKGAYQVASSNKDLSAAVDKLKGSFWATTSKASRDIKRGEVMKLAKMLESAEDNVFPLSHTLVEKVAACLKASNMKSGDQYLNELKLRHVEEGHDLPPWLINVDQNVQHVQESVDKVQGSDQTSFGSEAGGHQ